MMIKCLASLSQMKTKINIFKHFTVYYNVEGTRFLSVVQPAPDLKPLIYCEKPQMFSQRDIKVIETPNQRQYFSPRLHRSSNGRTENFGQNCQRCSAKQNHAAVHCDAHVMCCQICLEAPRKPGNVPAADVTDSICPNHRRRKPLFTISGSESVKIICQTSNW